MDVDLDKWGAEATISYDGGTLIVNDRILALIAEVRDWKNVAKGYHDELEKLREQFQNAVKSWKLNEEIDFDTIKDLKKLIAKFKIFGSDGCMSCATGRITLYTSCFKCIRCCPSDYDALALSSSEVKQGTSVCRHGVETDAKCIICWDKK